MLEIKNRFNELRKDQVFVWSGRLCLFLLAATLFVLLFFWRRLPAQVPFFFSLPWGEAQLTSPFVLIAAILTACILYGLSVVSVLFVYQVSRFFARMLLIGSAAICFLLVVTVVQIVLLMR